MKNIKLFEDFEINEELASEDMGEIVNKEIKIDYDSSFFNSFKRYCIEKLVLPLGFRAIKHKYDFVLMYDKNGGTKSTYVNIFITCDSLQKDLFIDIATGIGYFEKSFPNADTTKIKNVVDKVAYLSNLMIKNFAEKSDIKPDNALEQQKKFKEILIKDGFKEREDLMNKLKIN